MAAITPMKGEGSATLEVCTAKTYARGCEAKGRGGVKEEELVRVKKVRVVEKMQAFDMGDQSFCGLLVALRLKIGGIDSAGCNRVEDSTVGGGDRWRVARVSRCFPSKGDR